MTVKADPRPRRRTSVQIERSLQRKVMLRLARYPLIVLPTPNSMFIPTRSPAEKELVKRVVYQMKNNGMLVSGAPDLMVMWGSCCEHLGEEYPVTSCGCIELKRPASSDLLAKRAAGRPSESQRAFAERCHDLGINHCYASSWDEVRAALIEWGAPVTD